MTTPTETETTRWGKIPAWWLDHDDVDADGIAVLSALSTFADRQGRCWPSQTTLAAKLKRSRAWVNKVVARLAEIGLVEVKDRWSESGGRLSSLYVLATDREPSETAVSRENTPVTTADTPCHDGRQEHRNPEQTLDSLAKRGREPMHEVPGDWMPDGDDLAWARSRFGDIDLARHVEGFVLRCQAHGYRYRGIGAAWRAWLMQDVAAGKAPTAKTATTKPSTAKAGTLAGAMVVPSGRPRETAAEQRLGAWMAAAARLQTAARSPS
ncbi:MAG TPA: helix-turn-helix domain-containing protein [Azospirillum sp.]|nr:helix-turn-helix domain-containing protein [Azospirillum sp.]